jgi:hypothetical protein
MKKKYQLIIIITVLVVGVAACSKPSTGNGGGTPPPPPSPPPTCSSVSAKFTADINPIIQNSCAIAGCHGTGSNNGPGPLLTFDQIRNSAASIKSAVVSKNMPRGATLSNAQIQQISCWVDNGARND